jgi:5-methylcytosine-specific restriction endonuclease McrA
MDFGSSLQKSIARDQKAMKASMVRDQKAMKKSMNVNIKSSISKEGRTRIPAKRRKEVKEKYHHKCAVCKKKFPTMHVHHKNMKNSDNRLVNLEYLCPNHHSIKHTKAFRRTYKDLWGNKKGSRLVKKKPKPTKRKKRRVRRKTNSLGFNWGL